MEVLPTETEKFRIVIERNTFYFHSIEYEETYEGYITSIIQLLLLLRKRLAGKGLEKKVVTEFIREKENGLIAILALLGLSKESLLRLITFIRVVDDKELSALVNKEKCLTEEFKTVQRREVFRLAAPRMDFSLMEVNSTLNSIKGILNILRVKQDVIVFDPMYGSDHQFQKQTQNKRK